MSRNDSLPDYVNSLQVRGKDWFTRVEVKRATKANETILKKSLWRLE
jgi:hypothetical protein